MEILLLALTIGLPIMKILLFPARAIGRGGNWTLVGAAMIVALMMALWFGMQSFTSTPQVAPATASDKADAAAEQQAADALLKVLMPHG